MPSESLTDVTPDYFTSDDSLNSSKIEPELVSLLTDGISLENLSLDEKNRNFLKSFTKSLDAAFGSLKRKPKLDDDAESQVSAKEKRRRFSNQFIKSSVDFFGSLKRVPKVNDDNFLVANFDTRQGIFPTVLFKPRFQLVSILY